MGCGISSNSRIEDNIEIIKTNIKIENPKILIVQSESINIDRKKPTGYLEPDSQMNFTETNEDENQISEGVKN